MKKKNNNELYGNIDEIICKFKNYDNANLCIIADDYAEEVDKVNKKYKLASGIAIASAGIGCLSFAAFTLAANPVVKVVGLGLGITGFAAALISSGFIKRNNEKLLFLGKVEKEALKELYLRVDKLEDKKAKEIFSDIFDEREI